MENLGNSTLVTFTIISCVLIVGYVIDGREYIQGSILEVSTLLPSIWTNSSCLVAACLELGRNLHVHGHRCVRHPHLGQGGENQALRLPQPLRDRVQQVETSLSAQHDMCPCRNVDAGLSMGAMCIIIALVYAVDTLWSFVVRKRILRDEKA